MYCKNCGNPMDPNAAVCLNCGCAKGTGLSYCANCGQPVAPGAAVCTNCGKADYTQEEIITIANIPEATYKAHGHNYQLIESKPANCTSQGEDVFSCTFFQHTHKGKSA